MPFHDWVPLVIPWWRIPRRTSTAHAQTKLEQLIPQFGSSFACTRRTAQCLIQLATSVIARSQTASLMMVWLCALPGSSGGTKALWRHLGKHGWKSATDDDKAAVRAEHAERVASGLAPRDNPVQETPQKPRRELTAAARDRRETKAARFADSWAEGVGAKSPEQLGTRLVLPQAAVRRLHAAWAAKVVVCDLRPTTMGEGVGVASFITDDLIPALVSECTWQPPSHQVIADILERDFKTMKEQLKAQLEDVDRDEMILHADVWTDDWHRHWLGGILEWLCPLL